MTSSSQVFVFRYNVSIADFDAPSGYTSYVNYGGTINGQATYTWTPPIGWGSVDVLVVAGGGGGGHNNNAGGGGGGGGVAYINGFDVEKGGQYSIIVGDGGLGSTANTNKGSNGLNSAFYTLNATGGGGGGSRLNPTGASGGSGGGGTGYDGSTTPGTFLGGVGLYEQGNSGGNGLRDSIMQHSGGGGGAGQVGQSATTTLYGAGGNGREMSISGSANFYAGGGGGGGAEGPNTLNPLLPALGGLGGGGGGTNPNGLANTGGGGAGGGFSTGIPGKGGSGIVIIVFRAGSSFLPNTVNPMSLSTIRSKLRGPDSSGSISFSFQQQLLASQMYENPQFTSDSTVDNNFSSLFGWNTGSGWAVSASSSYSTTHAPWRAFDKVLSPSDSQQWISASQPTVQNPQWLMITYPFFVLLTSYVLTSRNVSDGQTRGPSKFRLQGLQNTTWIDLESDRTEYGWLQNESRTFEVFTKVACQSYRIYISESRSQNDSLAGNVWINQLQLFSINPPSGTLSLNSFENRRFSPFLGDRWALGVLDYLPSTQRPVVAYSLCRLFTSYIGPQVRVRRSGDNIETNVFLNANGLVYKIEGQGESDWATWRNGRTLFVIIWYDQSGIYNAVPPSIEFSPQLGSLANGSFAVDQNNLDGQNKYLIYKQGPIIDVNASNFTFFTKCELGYGAYPSGGQLFAQYSASNDHNHTLNVNSTSVTYDNYRPSGGSSPDINILIPSFTPSTISWQRSNGGGVVMMKNGSKITASEIYESYTGDVIVESTSGFRRFNNNSLYWTGKISTFIVFESALFNQENLHMAIL